MHLREPRISHVRYHGLNPSDAIDKTLRSDVDANSVAVRDSSSDFDFQDANAFSSPLRTGLYAPWKRVSTIVRRIHGSNGEHHNICSFWYSSYSIRTSL